MGFDINGLKAKSKKGEYFRNNVWHWRPLAEFVLANVNLPKKETEHWGTNDGQKVSENSAIKIADMIKEKFHDGSLLEYEREYHLRQDLAPRSLCELCNGKGRRADLPEQKECNACYGKGWIEARIGNYPFTLENVREFELFCRDSGGFIIY